jgi:hypothetical protein
MTGMRGPDFDELVGADVQGEERKRLRRAHDLLVAAGPAAPLPRSLAAPPLRRAARRTAVARVLPIAAALAVAAFAGGYLAGATGREESFETDFALVMDGTAAAPGASASLRIGELDEAGNWPMEMTIEGLPPGPRYELSLTRDGRPAVSCGVFVVEKGRTSVYLNAPYRFDEFDGWVVTREGSREVLLRDTEA